ncbi:unnamed protein product [Blepharisma stoltei]|uniref:TmcB/TmcC TPR repeats domain-containing protein n=1 Tax=Blepharisma stoltei TaxID=1481888 RepID=A0AAU9K9K5_9CILI|nr:unnamed protein product [Blepharisma stoltei]
MEDSNDALKTDAFDVAISTRLKKLLERLLNTLFETFYTIYKSSSSNIRAEGSKNKFYIHLARMILLTLQLLSLIFPPTLPSWESYHWFSSLISYTRFDYLFMTLSIGVIFLYIAAGAVVVPCLFLAYLYIKLYHKKPVKPTNYRITLSLGLKFTRVYAYLPFLCVFFATFKLWLLPENTLFEYDDADTSLIHAQYYGEFTLVLIVLLVALCLFQVMFLYDQYISKAKYDIGTRAHSKLEVFQVLSILVIAGNHFWIHENYPVAHFFITLVLASALSVGYVYYLPYFNVFLNFTHSAAYLTLSWGAFAQIWSYALDNGTMGFGLIVIVTPCLYLLLWEIVKRRVKLIDKSYINLESYGSLWLYELPTRLLVQEYLNIYKKEPEQALMIKEDINSLFRGMAKNYSNKKYVGLWEFAFTYSILKQDNLARIKLSQCRRAAFELEGSFHQYKYSKEIELAFHAYHEEVDFLKFRTMYEKALKFDEKCCDAQLQFWTELACEDLQIEKLEDLGYKLEKVVKKSRKLSKLLIKKYPSNQLALKLFGSFLLEVYNDSNKGNELVSRAEHEKQQFEKKMQTLGEKFNYFDNNNGILIVSGNPENFGNIESMNHIASNTLAIPIRFGLSMNISVFVPPPMNVASIHNKAMQNFILQCKTTEVGLPFSSFFIDYSSFIVEVFLQVRCVALDSYPFFIAAFKKNTKDREVILFDVEGFIISSTRGFAILTGYSDQPMNLKGVYAEMVLPTFNKLRKTYKPEQVIDYVLAGTVNKIFLKFHNHVAGSVTFSLLLATGNEEEKESWLSSMPEVTGFDELIGQEIPAAKEYTAPTYEKKGILKPPRMKSNKDCNVKFDLNPQVSYINETDFKPGKKIIGKEKDATSIQKPKVELEEIHDEEEEDKENTDKPDLVQNSAPVISNSKLIDLKDLDLIAPESYEDPNNLSSASGISGISGEIINIQQEPRKGTSIASSSNSSNASFTSSAVAQILLTGVNRSMFRFKVSFFITTVVVNMAILSMVIYMSVVAGQFQEKVVVKDVTQRRILNSYLALEGRNLYLSAVNYEISDTYETISNNMKADVESYADIVNRASKRLKTWPKGKYRDMYYNSEFMRFKLNDDIIVAETDNLMDLMRNMIEEGNILSATDASNIDNQNPSFFYLLRNGHSETLSALNESIYVLKSEERSMLTSVLNIVLILAVFAICLLIICLIVVLIPTLLSVEYSNQTVWSLFINLPLELIQEMRSRCEERLEQTHGCEPQLLTNIRVFKSLASREKVKAKAKWPRIICKMSIYYASSFLFFILFYFKGFLVYDNLLYTKPIVVDWAGQRVLAVNMVFFWLQEIKHHNQTWSYYNVIPYMRSAISLECELDKAIENLRWAEYYLLYGSVAYLGKSQSHKDLLLDKGCDIAECGFLERGLHSGIEDYIEDVSYARDLILSGQDVSIEDIRAQMKALLQLSTELRDKYISDIGSILDDTTLLIIGLTVAYIVFVLFLYFFVYIPGLNVIQREITSIWTLGRLIPIAHRAKILRTLKNNKLLNKAEKDE